MFPLSEYFHLCMSPLHSHQAYTISIPINHDSKACPNKHIQEHQHQLQIMSHFSINKIDPHQICCHWRLQQTYYKLPIIGSSSKEVAAAFGQVTNTSATMLQPMMQLCPALHHTHIIPGLSSNLLPSVEAFTNNGYISISRMDNDGETVHNCNDITIMTTKPSIL